MCYLLRFSRDCQLCTKNSKSLSLQEFFRRLAGGLAMTQRCVHIRRGEHCSSVTSTRCRTGGRPMVAPTCPYGAFPTLDCHAPAVLAMTTNILHFAFCILHYKKAGCYCSPLFSCFSLHNFLLLLGRFFGIGIILP